MRTKNDMLRDEIVRVATEEFLINGYRETSVRKIAKKLKKTTGAIYTYFESKEHLFVEITNKEFFWFLGEIQNDKFSKLSFEDKILKMVDFSFQPLKRIVREYGVNRTIDFLLVSADLAHKENLKQKNRGLDLQTLNSIKEILRAEISDKNIDIETLGIQIILIIDGALLNSMFLFDSLEEAEESCKKAIMQLLSLIR